MATTHRTPEQRVAVISRHIETGAQHFHRAVTLAARELGLNPGHLRAVLAGRRRRTGQFAFERYDDTSMVHRALRARLPERP